MAKADSVLDYDVHKVRSTILKAFKERRGEAAPADIVAFTGLPKPQVDAELPAVADEYSGRLKVTDSGEIVYSFPNGYRSRYAGLGPRLRRLGRALAKGAAAVGTFLFKAWIMVMLVGYFALFVALALLAVLASVAGSAADKDGKNRGRGGLGGLGLATRLIDLFVRIWFYNEIFKSPGQRRYEADARARGRAQRRPLHKAIFSFVFGEPDPNAEHGAVERRAFVALARAKKGVVLLEDFMAVTGLSPEAADAAINRYLYEFEGSPEVSDDGTVYYRFSRLLLRAREDDRGAADSPFMRLRPFSANSRKANVAYAAINGVNLAFGSYFLYHALAFEAVAAKGVTGGSYLFFFAGNLLLELGLSPLPIMTVGLGLVPLAFSVLFWLVPALRSAALAGQNERIRRGNMRRSLYAAALSSPSSFRAPDQAALPAAARPNDPGAVRAAVEELASYEGGDPLEGGAWRLAELERKVADAERERARLALEDRGLGGVAFDSGS